MGAKKRGCIRSKAYLVTTTEEASFLFFATLKNKKAEGVAYHGLVDLPLSHSISQIVTPKHRPITHVNLYKLGGVGTV